MESRTVFLTAAREADLSFNDMKEGLAALEESLRMQDELTELISLCLLQVNLGSMQIPLPVSMKLMALALPVWVDPSRCADELEAARDREAFRAEEVLTRIEKSAARCEQMLEQAENAFTA